MFPLCLHVDMDAFFASVEERSDPRFTGKAFAVGGGPGDRGVVTSASYPAREFGVRSGMSIAEARRRCPHLLTLPVSPAKYVHESTAVLAVLDRLSPRVEAASIDEAYVGFPPVPRARWEEIARMWGTRVRRVIERERGLPSSVGVAGNKLQAKMASALGKPRGLTVLPPGRFLEIFGEQPVSTIPGVGPRTAEGLAVHGIFTVGELAGANPDSLQSGFGKGGGILRDQARGMDGRLLFAAGEEPPPKSAGHETTFARDVKDAAALRATVWLLADRVGRRLRHHRFLARRVGIRFKVGGKRYSRQFTLVSPTDDPRHIALTAWRLLEGSRRGRALRLVGVVAMGLVRTAGEPTLFPEDHRRQAMIRIGDRIRDRFGENAILPAGVFLGKENE